jgi:hypothetical protein
MFPGILLVCMYACRLSIARLFMYGKHCLNKAFFVSLSTPPCQYLTVQTVSFLLPHLLTWFRDEMPLKLLAMRQNALLYFIDPKEIILKRTFFFNFFCLCLHSCPPLLQLGTTFTAAVQKTFKQCCNEEDRGRIRFFQPRQIGYKTSPL